jgi:hypothetical protein
MHNPARKLPIRARNETSHLVLSLQSDSPRKLAPRSIATYARSMGARITHNTKDCFMNEKDGLEKANFRAAKEGGKKPNSAKQSFAQLGKK